MEGNKDMEVANVAIQRLIEEGVETSIGDGAMNHISKEEAISDIIAAEMTESTTEEEIVKELKKVRRQNTVTHCLLSIMIVLTVTWQLSEVSLILKVKDGVSHPFRTLGSTLTGMFKKVTAKKKNGKDNLEESLEQLTESIPALKLPELPKMDMKGFCSDAIDKSPP